MFLKRFKEKSNQKYINKILDSRNANVNGRPINSVGIVVDYDEFNDYEVFRKFFKSININENKVKFIGFIRNEKELPNSWDSFYHSKEFGWHGNMTNVVLQEFVDTEFDMLISYTKSNSYELNVVPALSKANFKVGIADHDERLHDCIIKVEIDQVETFKTELLKYLKVLNLI